MSSYDLSSDSVSLDFFKSIPEDEKGPVRVVVRHGEAVLLDLTAKEDNLEAWRDAWKKKRNDQDDFQAIKKNVTICIDKLDIIKDKNGSFSTWTDRYTWLKVVIAYLLHFEEAKNKAEAASLLKIDYGEFFAEGLKQEPETFSVALWEDMHVVGELCVILQKNMDGQENMNGKNLKTWGLSFIKNSLQATDQTGDERSIQQRILQLSHVGLVLSENTKDFAYFSHKIFQINEEHLDKHQKHRALHWALDKVIHLDAPANKKKQNVEREPTYDGDQSQSTITVAKPRAEHHPSLIHIIADQHLRHYDIERALGAWEKLQHKPLPLRMLLNVYTGNGPYIAIILWLILLALLEMEITISPGGAAVLAGLIGVGMTIFLFCVATDFVRRRGYAFGHLFLQRLIGASMAGLTLIALTADGWEMGLFIQRVNWFLVTLGGFFLADFFLFFKIYQERARTGYAFDGARGGKSFDQTQSSSSKSKFSFRNWFWKDARQTFKKEIFGVSFRILTLHVLLTMMIAFLMSGMLYHAFQKILDIQATSIPIANCCQVTRIGNIAVALEVGRHFSFGFSPKLILLWSSMSILLGAFVQLLWDETLLAGA